MQKAAQSEKAGEDDGRRSRRRIIVEDEFHDRHVLLRMALAGKRTSPECDGSCEIGNRQLADQPGDFISHEQAEGPQ